MSLTRLAWESVRHYWRGHLGVLFGATLAAAVLVGALVVGDSVRYSLRQQAIARVGEVHYAVTGGDRFFRQALADELGQSLESTVAPIIQVRGTASRAGTQERVSRVQIVGVDSRFWALGGSGDLLGEGEGVVALNEKLAAALGVGSGAEVLLRLEKPGLISRDAPLSSVADASTTMRLRVGAVADAAHFGRFSFNSSQLTPHTAFVPLGELQERLDRSQRANVLLVGSPPAGKHSVTAVTEVLASHLHLADAELELRTGGSLDLLQLSSPRVFLPETLAAACRRLEPQTRSVLTYLVNEISCEQRTTPYSFVTAADEPPVPADLGLDGIVLNEWLAADLDAKVGSTVRLTYYVVGNSRSLAEQSHTFTVRDIVPQTAQHRDFTPHYPGLTEVDNCRDWDPGIPLDLDRVRPKDERYWDAYGPTPKAFVSFEAGRQLWGNRFGDRTAIRIPVGAKTTPARLESALMREVTPAEVGLRVLPVREKALESAEEALDFGQLFLGLSFFLLAAAVVLMVLLFVFGVEQRSSQTGLLLALGLTQGQVRRLMLVEGAALSALGGVVGTAAAVAYGRVVMGALNGVWGGAVAGAELQFHATSGTLLGGAFTGFVVAVVSIWVGVRKQARIPARVLLTSPVGIERPAPAAVSRPKGLLWGSLSVVGALVLAGAGGSGSGEQAVGLFFGAGSLLLIGGLLLCRAFLGAVSQRMRSSRLSLWSLGLRNATRRTGRSVATIALLASGCFLVVAVGANRKDPGAHVGERSSGTGGFALLGETSLPVFVDLNTESGREAFDLSEGELEGVSFVQLRQHEGDDASCLNLSRAQTPTVLGVAPEALSSRGAFTFVKGGGKGHQATWALLTEDSADFVPTVGDQNTLMWGLEKKVGDTIPHEGAVPEPLKVTGIIGASILQGRLLVSEEEFVRLFPHDEGYRVFLIDCPSDRRAAVAQRLSEAMVDVGLNLVPTEQRLAEFQTVENTYLSIFAVLGGLGMILGTLGLGAVVLRNVLERRGELAVLRAVGYPHSTLVALVFGEHVLLVALGLGVGVVSALVAVVPALRAPGAEVPLASLGMTLIAIAVSGLLWTAVAAWASVRGPLLEALRTE